jgi:hypothetical protein
LQQPVGARAPSFRAGRQRFVASGWPAGAGLGTLRCIGATRLSSTTGSPIMFIAIVQHTPVWVWGLLTALVGLGLAQSRDRELSLKRVTILPLVLLALSAGGVLSAFGHAPVAPVALGGWGTGLAAALTLGRHFVAVRGAAWLAGSATLRVPGSWLPLVLIVALFSLKYFVGVSLALHPALANEAAFAGTCSLAYGAFSGLFAARALSLRALARTPAFAPGA